MDRFFPLHTTELLLDPAIISATKAWLRESSGPTAALVIDTTASGIGVSTLIRLACEEEHIEPITISTHVTKLKILLRDAANSAYTVEFKKKVLIIDPVDAVLADPTNATDLAEFFKAGAPIPAVFAGHKLRSSMAKLNDMLSSKLYRITRLHVDPPPREKALAFLKTVQETLGAHAVDLETVWQGDIRNALAALAVNVSNATKDEQCDGVDAVARALFDDSLTIRDSIHMHEGDITMISAGTHENYPRTGQPIDRCVVLADIYSLTDVMEERMYESQRWDLGDVHTALIAGGPVVSLDKQAAKKHRALDLSKFGTIWSRGNNQRTKEKKLKEIRRVMTERGLRGAQDIDSVATIRHLVMHATKTDPESWPHVLETLAELPNETILDIMRLWKSGYTQAHHSGLKKRRV